MIKFKVVDCKGVTHFVEATRFYVSDGNNVVFQTVEKIDNVTSYTQTALFYQPISIETILDDRTDTDSQEVA